MFNNLPVKAPTNSTSIIDPQTGLTVTLKIVSVTPDLAKEYLSKTAVDQRKMRPSTVAGYAEQMRKQLWVGANGEAIKISSDGNLIDGQHRMKAIVMSGCTVDMMVMEGIHEDNITTLDNGRPRSFIDTLTVNEVVDAGMNAAQISTFIKGIIKIKQRVVKNKGETIVRQLTSNKELLLFVRNNPDLIDSLRDFSSNFKVHPITKIGGKCAPLILWHIFRHEPESPTVYAILKTIETGYPHNQYLADEAASFVLHRATINLKMSDRRTIITTEEHLILLLWAMEKEAKNHKIKRCNIKKIVTQSLLDSRYIKKIYESLATLK